MFTAYTTLKIHQFYAWPLLYVHARNWQRKTGSVYWLLVTQVCAFHGRCISPNVSSAGERGQIRAAYQVVDTCYLHHRFVCRSSSWQLSASSSGREGGIVLDARTFNDAWTKDTREKSYERSKYHDATGCIKWSFTLYIGAHPFNVEKTFFRFHGRITIYMITLISDFGSISNADIEFYFLTWTFFCKSKFIANWRDECRIIF